MVSILVPVYNKSPHELRRCFESILNQTCIDFELIITDDGSDIETATFLDEYAEINKSRCIGGVHCYHYPNGGVWVARNLGQSKASGEWLMHVNADDFISPITIETALKATESSTNIDMIYWSMWDASWPLYLYRGQGGNRLYKNPKTDRFVIGQTPLCATPFCDVTCMVRREKALPFDPNLVGAEFEHQVRVIANCQSIYFIDMPLYTYISGENTISTTHADLNWRISAIKDFHNSLLENNFSELNDDIIARAVGVIHYAMSDTTSNYKKLYDSIIGVIVRSISVKKTSMTKKIRVINFLFKTKQFFLLGIILRFIRKLSNKQHNRNELKKLHDNSERDDFNMNDFHPLVSIVIPVYNGSNYLREAIDSALNQTYDKIEIIVVNDGSNDDTEQIAMSYGDRVRYFSKENGGTSTALNMGIANMRGDYFSWLSHDDQYYPQKIEREIIALSKLSNKNTIILCNWDVINADYDKIDVIRCESSIKEYPAREKSQLFHVLYAHIHGCAMLIPKACFDIVGIFDEKRRVSQDYDYFIRMLKVFPHKHIPEVLTIARDGLNRQGKYASTCCNIEYSLLLINVIEQLTDDEILEMATKRDFYCFLKDFYFAAGFTIAGEYMHTMAASFGYLDEVDVVPLSEFQSVSQSRYTKLNRFRRALKRYGYIGTVKKAYVRLLSRSSKSKEELIPMSLPTEQNSNLSEVVPTSIPAPIAKKYIFTGIIKKLLRPIYQRVHNRFVGAILVEMQQHKNQIMMEIQQSKEKFSIEQQENREEYLLQSNKYISVELQKSLQETMSCVSSELQKSLQETKSYVSSELQKSLQETMNYISCKSQQNIEQLLVRAEQFESDMRLMAIGSFAQYQDDIIVRGFFDRIGVKHPSYLDIGANHPIELSNTYHFYRSGSRGVLVEPNESLLNELNKIRPDDTLLSVGVAGKNIKDKAIFNFSSEHHVLNTFVTENMEFHGVKPTNTKEIDLVDINEILEKYFEGNCDFISIDVEGMEFDILSTLDFNRFRIKLFIIEVPIDNKIKIELYKLMFSNRYCILYEPISYGNVIFIDSELKAKHFESIFGGNLATVLWQRDIEKTDLELENARLNAQIQQLYFEKTNLEKG